jgi:hypothetical protein
MKLVEAIRDLDSLDAEATIYGSRPWSENSEAAVAREPQFGGILMLPPDMSYFLEVFIARDFLSDWAANLDVQPTLQQKCARVIQYAVTDA